MSQNANDKQIFSLLEVTKSIQKTIANRYQSTFWVKAEMNKLNLYTRSGHCYPELVEKQDGKVIAQISAILWKSEYQKVNTNFQRILKEPLKDGIKILFSTKINFDPKYGLTLQILDIDASFTLGDLEKEKRNTIKKLRSQGVFLKNKQLELPVLPQRIAIISVESSKGYADFLSIFNSASSAHSYAFFKILFSSLLQGDNAVLTLVAQLRRIKTVIDHFDVVAIIRGGGGDIGLSCYNNYDLAKEIAEFPIPVITGIGHSTNETVVEMIAHENAITPTKLAEFIIQKFHDFSVPMYHAEEKIRNESLRLIWDEHIKFKSEIKLLRSISRNILGHNKSLIAQKGQSIFQRSRFRLRTENTALLATGSDIKKGIDQFCTEKEKQLLQNAIHLKREAKRQLDQISQGLKSEEKNIENLSPENVFKRGYSMAHLNGKPVLSSRELNEGDSLTTTFFKGSVFSTVTSTDKDKL